MRRSACVSSPCSLSLTLLTHAALIRTLLPRLLSLVNGKYLSAIGVNGKTIHLGTFKTAEEANAAYGRAAVKYFGEFANW